MAERISAAEFAAAEGTADWLIVDGFAQATFRTGSFARGIDLVDAIGALAEAADHHPDVDLRYLTVTVRMRTHDVDGLSARDIVLARSISATARSLGILP